MSSEAFTTRQARSAWSSPFQFESSGGGLGVELTATTSSSRVQIVGDGFTVRVANDGSVAASVAFGDSSVTATLSYTRVNPGTSEMFTLRPEDAATHVAAITRSGSTYIQVTRGNGG